MKASKSAMGDRLIAIALSVFMLILTFASLEKNVSHWGDDFAAYMLEGLAIADDRLDEQAGINYFMHPSPLNKSISEERLVYPWGYSLILSGVYKLVGFDRTDFSELIYYKIPSAIALSLTVPVLYLLFRRRTDRLSAAAIALFFAVSCDMFLLLNSLYGDLVFMFFAMLSLYMAERFTDISPERPIFLFIYAVLLAFVFFAAYEIRLNGITIIGVCALYHLIQIFTGKNPLKARILLSRVLAYLLFLLLIPIGNRLLLPATHNVSDTASASFATIINNGEFYLRNLLKIFSNITGGIPPKFGVALFPVIVIGMLTQMFRKENLHISVLFVGTFAVNLYLPFTQAFRYIYPVIPFIIFYVASGFKWIFSYLRTKINPAAARFVRIVFLAVLFVCLLIPFGKLSYDAVDNIRSGFKADKNTPYSEAGIDMYAYIRSNTPEDSVICFFKPRQLYLATQRMCFCKDMNGHDITSADYYLESVYNAGSARISDHNSDAGNPVVYSLVYENDELRLYKVTNKTE